VGECHTRGRVFCVGYGRIGIKAKVRMLLARIEEPVRPSGRMRYWAGWRARAASPGVVKSQAGSGGAFFALGR
jgi:hypothetical protein